MNNRECKIIVLEMLEILKTLGSYNYNKCKLCLLAIDTNYALHNLLVELFKVADKERPLLLEMK